MNHLAEELAAAAQRWRDTGWPRPGVALVAGSGLSVDLGLPSAGREPLQRFLPWAVEAVAGHALEVELLLPRAAAPVVYFRGRLHAYQGYTPAQVVFPVRLAALLGARTLILTNASGGVDPELRAGELVQVVDHLNLTGMNPLSGDPPEAWGARFPDLSAAYAPELRELLARHAQALGVPLRQGVYAAVPGPSYETPAEVRMLRTLGADLVGMSTALEVIAAVHMGVRCACLSLVANPGAGLVPVPLTHEEVLAAGRGAAETVRRLLARVLADPALAGAAPALPAGGGAS